MTELIDYCQGRMNELRRDIEALVRLESPSDDKVAVDRCGDVIARMLADRGARVQRLPQAARGNHIRAEFAGGPRRVLVLGHFDTVWPVGQLDRMPVREQDGCLHGPGVYDMKASIAVAMLAVSALQVFRLKAEATRQSEGSGDPDLPSRGFRLGAEGHTPHIVMLWTTDEEVGSGTSRALIEQEARASDAVLVAEPSLPGGACKTQRKGCGEFTLTVHGVPAHAGIDPRTGASAIHELARQILVLEALRDLDRGVSVNVGRISGGSRSNVVAETAQAVFDVRVPTMADAARIEASVAALRPENPQTRLEIAGGVGRPPMERTAGVGRLYSQAREVAQSLGRDLAEGGTGGGSDGNFTAALGVPTLDGLGPDGDGAHALHEHVLLADLPWRAAFLAGLLHRINMAKE